MSCHLKIQTRITDISLLEECLRHLGYDVTRRPVADRRGDVVLAVAGEPEPGARAIHFDVAWREGHPVDLLGDSQELSKARVERLHQAYAERMVLREAQARGFTGVERREVNGEIVITLRKWVA